MSNWSKIKEHIERVESWSPNKEIPYDHFEYIDISSINRLQKCIDTNAVLKILGENAPSRARQKIKTGDILVSTVRPNLNGIALVDNGFINGTASTGYCVLRPKSTLHTKYLFYWLQTKAFVEDMTNKASGASYPAVSDKIIKESKIPLPPLETQKKIVEILDAADTLLQKTKTLIEKYDQLTQSIFLNMFGNPMINHKSWITKELKNLGKVVTGSTPSSTKKDMFGGSIPFVTPGDLESLYPVKRSLTELGSINSRTVKKGSLLVCCIGATIGKTDIAKEMSAFNQQINAVEWLNEVNSHYALIAFKYLRQRVISRGISTTLPILKKSEFEKIKLPLPPLTLQNQFAERVQAIEGQKAKAQVSLDKAEELFQSLLQKAFKGEIN